LISTSISRVAFATLAALLSSVDVQALAQAGRDSLVGTSLEYSATIDRALVEFDANHYEEARALFTRAHALQPNARTLRGLGVVEFKLGNHAQAVEYLARALESHDKPLVGELRSTTETALAEARVTLDQAAPSPEPRDMAEGDEFAHARGNARGGDEHVLNLEAPATLPDPESIAKATQVKPPLPRTAAPAHVEDPSPADESSHQKTWSWILGTGAGSLVLSGGVLVWLARNDISKVENAEPGTQWRELQPAYERAPTRLALGVTLLAVGAAGAAGLIVWRVSSSSSRDAADSSLALGPGRCELRGRF